ncbi:MAG: amidohydrolase family protein [Saprospiraceae bacterium]|jgi:N-acyl-D-amino-acid deacylase|nr:amidohydrolase family protein [Saprospiraceae bacterium]
MKNQIFFFYLVFGLFFSGILSAQQPDPFDLIITNGRIMDGSGNPWFYGDIAIRGERIVEIGALSHTHARKTLDVKGSIVCPGFIDIHSHADDTYGRNNIRSDNPILRAAHNMVMQGVTTLVVNHDGRSPDSIEEQRKQMERGGVGPNVALMVGHNSIRRRAMGDDYQRLATPQEIEKMKMFIAEGMEAGAYGLSAGLEYVPGRWSNTEEVIELVASVKPYGGVYIVHERYSGSDPMWYLPSRDGQSPGNAIDNISEVIKVAESTGVPSCATHIKVKGADLWGASTTLVNLVNRARARGVEVWADQYPYTTSGTDGNTVLLPDWALELEGKNKQEALQYHLSLPGNRAKFDQDVLREIERRGGPENVVVFEHPVEAYVGKSLSTIAQETNLSMIDAAIHLQMSGDPKRDGGGRMRGFSMSEQDIEFLAQQPWVITASDAGLGLPFSPVHARFYGTFPRKIAHYAKTRGVISMEHAVRSATSLPAQFMGFSDRGLLREGNVADILVFDPEKIQDKATFFEPHQYPEGIEQVIVNGTFLVENGKLVQETFPGKVLHISDSRRNPK